MQVSAYFALFLQKSRAIWYKYFIITFFSIILYNLSLKIASDTCAVSEILKTSSTNSKRGFQTCCKKWHQTINKQKMSENFEFDYTFKIFNIANRSNAIF